MENKSKVEVPVQSEKEFAETLSQMKEFHNLGGGLYLYSFDCVNRFRSVRRAFRRGLISPTGEIYPKRPFKNGANKSKRKGKHSKATQELKKQIYVRIKNARAKTVVA